MGNTVKSLFVAAATIDFDEILVQILLSKNCVLLRPLFKGGYYLRAATNKDFTVYFRFLAVCAVWVHKWPLKLAFFAYSLSSAQPIF